MNTNKKILFFTDIHLRSSFPNHKSDPIYKSKGLRYIKESLDWVITKVKELSPDLVIFGGDLIDSPKRIDFTSLNLATDFFQEVSLLAETYAIVGNHDRQGGPEWSHALYSLDSIPRVTVVDRPIPVPDTEILILPYMKEMTSEAREAISSKHTKVTFTHIGFKELTFSTGGSFGPFKFEDFNSDYVISGHYHIPTTFNQGRMRYPGALLAKNFHDAGDHPFGLEIIDISSTGVEFSHIVNPFSPRYIKLRDDQLDHLDFYNSKSDIQYFFKIKTSDPTGLDDKLSKLNVSKEDILQISPEKIDFSLTGAEEKISSSLSVEEAIESYVEEVASASQNGTFLTSLGLDLYQQADITAAKRQRAVYHLSSIEMIHFMSSGYNHLHFEEGLIFLDGRNLDDEGSNGAGKSLVLESLYWTLFGKTIRIVDKAEDVCHNRVGKCAVVVTLTSSLGDELIIQRYRSLIGFGSGTKVFIQRYADSKVSKVSSGNSVSVISKDKYIYLDENKNPRARLRDPKTATHSYLSKGMNQSSTNTLIKELLGVDPRLFKLTTLFSKRSTQLTGATEGSRAGEFLAFLDLGTEETSIIAKEERRVLKLQIEEKELEATQFEFKKEQEMLSYTKTIDSCLLQRSNQESMKDTTSASMNDLRVQGRELKSWFLNQGEINLLELEKEVQQSLALKSSLYSDLNRSGALVGIREKQLKDFNRFLKNGLDTNSQNCPTCYSSLISSDLDQVKLVLEGDYDSAVAQRDRDKSRLERKIEKLGIQEKQMRLEEARRVQGELLSNRARFTTIKKTLTALKSNMEQIQNSIDKLTSDIESLQENIITISQTVYEGESIEVELRKRLNGIEFWCKGFSRRGLPSFLLRKVLSFANERLFLYLSIVSGSKLKARFDTSDSGVKLTCTRPDGERPYSTLSDGQQSCVDLAVQLALHDVQRLSLGGLGLMFFDEAISHIDVPKALKCIEMIKEKLESVPLIFITTHRDSIIPDDSIGLTAILENEYTRYERRE